MRRRHYWLALLAIPAVWLYTLGRSAGELVSVLSAPVALVRAEPPAAEPGTPPAAPPARRAAAVAATPADVVDAPFAATPPAAAPVRAAPPSSPLPAPAVYSAESAETAGALVEHPEVTDPRMRKLLQPAWDD